MAAKSPENYSSLPTTSSTTYSPPNPTFLSRFAHQSRTLSYTRRPWRDLFSLSSFSLPLGFQDATIRVRRNLNYYRSNYSLIVLIIVFFSLLWHPISMIVFLAVFILWLFLYFSRDDPIVIFGREIDDRIVLLGLGIVTILALVLTHVWLNVLISLLIAFFLIALHAAIRSCDDQFLDEDDVY